MRLQTLTATISALLLLSTAAHANDKSVPLRAQPVADGIAMLMGAGGNIGVSTGEDGTLIIDDQYDYQAEEIAAALERLGAEPPRFVINTHYHGDHTGSNAAFSAAATVLAHDNVRIRMASLGAEAAALPNLTFDDRVTVYVNGETISVVHAARGHTDGDSIVIFNDSNVMHMGDHLFNGSFPYIDLDAGGTVQGYIENLLWALEETDDATRIIPGHGPLASADDIEQTIEVLYATREVVIRGVGDGKSVEQLVAEGLDEEFASWGKGFINEERWIQTLYKDLMMQ
ncbi:MAG: MBL fold metallo-hydrolase [Pseudomonadaceae bacterium]|nr:MBL fold metallo-hydrolase [Pseudomonadaceae bacterium]